MAGPPTKKVKFSKIHDELAAHFTDTKFNSLAVSQAVKEAFPNTESRHCGKANHRFVFGLQEQESLSTRRTLSAITWCVIFLRRYLHQVQQGWLLFRLVSKTAMCF